MNRTIKTALFGMAVVISGTLVLDFTGKANTGFALCALGGMMMILAPFNDK